MATFYYNNADSDYDYSNLNNWWLSNPTEPNPIPATSLPGAADDVIALGDCYVDTTYSYPYNIKSLTLNGTTKWGIPINADGGSGSVVLNNSASLYGSIELSPSITAGSVIFNDSSYFASVANITSPVITFNDNSYIDNIDAIGNSPSWGGTNLVVTFNNNNPTNQDIYIDPTLSQLININGNVEFTKSSYNKDYVWVLDISGDIIFSSSSPISFTLEDGSTWGSDMTSWTFPNLPNPESSVSLNFLGDGAIGPGGNISGKIIGNVISTSGEGGVYNFDIGGNLTLGGKWESGGGSSGIQVDGNVTLNDGSVFYGNCDGDLTLNDIDDPNNHFYSLQWSSDRIYNGSTIGGDLIINDGYLFTSDFLNLGAGISVGGEVYFNSSEDIEFNLSGFGNNWASDASLWNFPNSTPYWTFSDIASNTINGTVINASFIGTESANNGTVTEDAVFSGSSYNNGTVSGNATFNDSAYNHDDGSVIGDAIFTKSSYILNDNDFDFFNYKWIPWRGTITGNTIFSSETAVVFTCEGEHNWTNYNGDIDYSKWIFETAGPSWIFNDQSMLTNGVCAGNVTFNDDSLINGDGTINGDAIFTKSSYSINNDGFQSEWEKWNYATITGDIIFSSLTPVTFTITGASWIADTTNWVFTTPNPTWIFNNNSSNNGIINGDVTFNDDSYNNNYGTYGSTINGNVIFNDSSYNLGEIAAPSFITFNGNSGHGVSDWSVNNGAGNISAIDTITFNDYSSNFNQANAENIIFNDYSYNWGTTGGENTTFNDNSYNISIVNSFSETSILIFNDNSSNGNPDPALISQGGSVDAKTIYFNDNSFNLFYVNSFIDDGDVIFNDQAYNAGTLGGDATFNGSSYNLEGIVNGTATFSLTSANIMITNAYAGTYGSVGFKYEKGINGSSILGIV